MVRVMIANIQSEVQGGCMLGVPLSKGRAAASDCRGDAVNAQEGQRNGRVNASNVCLC